MLLTVSLICGISVGASVFTFVYARKMKESLDIDISTLSGEIEHLDAVVVTLESRIDELPPTNDDYVPMETVLPDTTSAFDARIAQFREELNTPTYSDNVAQTYHPNVYNVPHESVQDVPIKYEPEYAD